jgi:hypothetical protein
MRSRAKVRKWVLYGEVGKRRVIQRLASELGLAIIEVNAADSATFVAARLFGASSASKAAEPIYISAGELARSDDVIILLSAFSNSSVVD